ncbi:hypothetical protein XA68_13146 [Ophiocordyceps unilateralis]|uniref:Uncharacterized protein n=1 Tax=Ophiocordyceps unilateralis TaxID=268505 RepID=A0A2A9PD90_OPHUN|nr:hypothetical protein XA68_13146 [Ophiocordyceps unilateralis]
MIVNLMLLHAALAAPTFNNTITGHIFFNRSVTLNNTLTFNNTKVNFIQTGNCVQGTPASNDQFDIQYERVRPGALREMNGSIIEPGFFNRYAAVGKSVLLSVGNPFTTYAEFRCQFTCNAIPGCASFVGYEKSMPGNFSNFQCQFFNSSIKPENIIPKPAGSNATLTNAYNKLCQQDLGGALDTEVGQGGFGQSIVGAEQDTGDGQVGDGQLVGNGLDTGAEQGAGGEQSEGGQDLEGEDLQGVQDLDNEDNSTGPLSDVGQSID